MEKIIKEKSQFLKIWLRNTYGVKRKSQTQSTTQHSQENSEKQENPPAQVLKIVPEHIPLQEPESMPMQEHEHETAMRECIEAGLFDPQWYRETYSIDFEDDFAIFSDYLTKSRFSPVNPSPAFDSETYLRENIDVFHHQISPLYHYINNGKIEGRTHGPAINRWSPREILTPERTIGEKAKTLKIAICLHIFYDDFIDRFAQALDAFPVEIDLLLTLAKEEFTDHARNTLGGHPRVNKTEIRIVPNRGRNFGPMLVEYSKEIKEYDLFCHLHSKKSLFSGKEQTQWADYLTEYLLRDPNIISGVLNSFAEDEKLGLYYPTTFWMMPVWVNHVTMNVPFIREWEKALDLPPGTEFISYPVGGMFWARPEALDGVIREGWEYDDFPSEPLPNDGSMLHALERVLGSLVEGKGYKQFFYYPTTGQFTTDQSYTTSSYRGTIEQHLPSIQAHACISFDVFDTLVRREYTVADYAKLKLGKHLCEQGMVDDPHDFIKLRNSAEFELRKRANFQGDVIIDDIYKELGSKLGISEADADGLMRKEFELDLEMILPKNEMVELFNHLGSVGHKLWVISDSYYTREQVGLMLRKVGIAVPYRLLVSSTEQKRKDNGSMWAMIKQDLAQEGIDRHLHIGDNVVADAQRPGDIGLTTFHILHPMEKWQALGFPKVLRGSDALDEGQILKWGKLVSQVGRNPFIGE
ncbi:rhamnan synthesis F family protein [Halomonas cupida]|uniref:rhamnan synthesis F family protein n=1 Tax=Halomonas cupida TaxID=44933 RepID=UPI003A8EFB45